MVIDCNGKLEMVICKNIPDAIRLYNKIEIESVNKKFKYIAFMGDVSKGKYRLDWRKRLQDLTHWSNEKINRSSTRP